MLISEAFPSKYLKAADLNGRELKVTIDRVEMRDIFGVPKLVICFRDNTKDFVCNKTNATTIAGYAGNSTENWPGLDIILYPTMVTFRGEPVSAIRVKLPTRKNDNIAMLRSGNSAAAPQDEVPF
jgi:hypothetical protein